MSQPSTITVSGAVVPSDTTPHRHPHLVVHPLDDVPEEKVRTEHLLPIAMTQSVRISLFSLRAYLILMMLLLLYHVLDLAGLFHR